MPNLDALWADPAHWSIWGYHCKADPRVVVPKRTIALGWTINWEHPRALPTLFGMVAIVTLPTFGIVGLALAQVLDPVTTGLAAIGSTLVSVVIVSVMCMRLARAS